MAWCCVVDVAVLLFFRSVIVMVFFDFWVNNSIHFDRVSFQNLKFQFEFEYCAPLGKPV